MKVLPFFPKNQSRYIRTRFVKRDGNVFIAVDRIPFAAPSTSQAAYTALVV